MTNKVVKTIVVILLVAIVSIISFLGVFKEENGIMKNIVPEIKYGMEIDGVRELRYVLDDSSEEKNVYVDEEGNIHGTVIEKETATEETTGEISLDTTVEDEETKKDVEVAVPLDEKIPYKVETRTIYANPNIIELVDFENTKRIIQERLSTDKTLEYNIRLDTLSNNQLVVEVPNNEEYVSFVRTMVENNADFEIVDSENGIRLMDGSALKSAVVGVGAGQNDPTLYQVYLTLTLNKEGKETIREISKKYVESVDANGEDNSKSVTIRINGSDILPTVFSEEYSSNIIQVPIGTEMEYSEDLDVLVEYANYYANFINSGDMPLKYSLQSDNYIQSEITNDTVNYVKVAIAVALAIIVIVFIIKFKLEGLLAGILNVGFFALIILVVKYTDVIITLNSVFALICAVAINVAFMYLYLTKVKLGDNRKEAYIDVVKKVYLSIVPMMIIAVIFACMGNAVVASIGTMLFWGILLQFIYSFVAIRCIYVK